MYFFDEVCKILQERIDQDPNQFFTEHDIHAEIYLIFSRLTTELGYNQVRTKDGHLANTVHHEYPTPFRADMKSGGFRIIPEYLSDSSSFTRPRIDCVILNPEFIRNNPLRVVAGKDFRILKENLNNQKHSVLKTAVEVVYFPFTPITSRKYMGKRDIDSVIQDYLKLAALRDYEFNNQVPYSEEAGMLAISNKISEEEFNTKITRLNVKRNVKITFITNRLPTAPPRVRGRPFSIMGNQKSRKRTQKSSRV